MKFKNYKNSETGDDRIYSYKDIKGMPLGEVLKRKKELLSQYRVLGVPTESELHGSENAVYVESYTREDGTEVKGYWRSKPEGSYAEDIKDTTDDGINPAETIKENYDEQDSYDSELDDTFVKPETEEYKQKYRELENQKSIERKDPDEIVGVKRGEPKTFQEAIEGGCNPDYYESEEYFNNCTCCVIALEARLRGYSVHANGQDFTGELEELSNNPFWAWTDPVTGEKSEGTNIQAEDTNDFLYEIGNIVQSGQRYNLVYCTETVIDGEYRADGHIISVDRDQEGNLRLYDPQSDSLKQGDIINGFVDALVCLKNPKLKPKILRVDNKVINPVYSGVALVPD